MGQQVQESQIANYQRRMQREAPACRLRSLFEQNDVLHQVYTVAVIDGVQVSSDDTLHATVAQGAGSARFIVSAGASTAGGWSGNSALCRRTPRWTR